MGNIKIIKGVFDSSLELVHAEVAAGFPDIRIVMGNSHGDRHPYPGACPHDYPGTRYLFHAL